MSACTNSVAGGGILKIFEALQRLQNDPNRLAHEFQLYNQSPLSCQSVATTQPQSLSKPPQDLSQADHEMQRRRDRLKAIPYNQYDYQWRREYDRILEQIDRRRERRKPTLPYQMGDEFLKTAQNNVRNRWIEQGTWSDEWDIRSQWPGAHWKHEERPEPLPEPGPPIMSLFGPITDFRPRQSKEEYEEIIRAHECDTVASRPYHQFVYQISKEREWLEDELNIEDVDIDAKAYQDVKSSWIKQGIWDPRWRDMPGMTWIHEEPDPGPVENPKHPAAITENHDQPLNAAPITQTTDFPSPLMDEDTDRQPEQPDNESL
jgi:hypothetical protein